MALGILATCLARRSAGTSQPASRPFAHAPVSAQESPAHDISPSPARPAASPSPAPSPRLSCKSPPPGTTQRQKATLERARKRPASRTRLPACRTTARCLSRLAQPFCGPWRRQRQRPRLAGEAEHRPLSAITWPLSAERLTSSRRLEYRAAALGPAAAPVAK